MICFEELPDPESGALTLYILGPGFGESQVVSMPDGAWMVVDACDQGGGSATLGLLEHFGVEKVTRLVVTHPDLDHIDGLVELLDSDIEIERIWRYPHGSLVRDFLGEWAQEFGSSRYSTLQEVIDRLESHATANRTFSAEYKARTWSSGGSYSVHVIAPTPHDVQRMRDQFNELLDVTKGDADVADRLVSFLLGNQWSDRPNIVSLALTIEWGDWKVLLAGDLEEGTSSSHSGWSGVLGLLEEDEQLELLTDLSVVKVAHHGSDGACCGRAWALHSDSRRVQVACVTPFNRGSNQPPHLEALSGLRQSHVNQLAVTSPAGGAQDTAEDAGWTVDSNGSSAGTGVAAAAIVLRDDDPPEVHLSGSAKLYRRS